MRVRAPRNSPSSSIHGPSIVIVSRRLAAGPRVRADGRDMTLAEAQIVGESALYAEARMGELLEERPAQVRASRGGSPKSLPPDIGHKASPHAQELSRHPEAIKAVIAEAKASGEVPRGNGPRRSPARSSAPVTPIARGQRGFFPAEQDGFGRGVRVRRGPRRRARGPALQGCGGTLLRY